MIVLTHSSSSQLTGSIDTLFVSGVFGREKIVGRVNLVVWIASLAFDYMF